MRFKNKTLATFMCMGLALGCKKENTPISQPVSQTEETVSSNITGQVTWSANKVYVLKKYIYVDSLAKLTIEPGTIIKGGTDDVTGTKGALIIKRGGQLFADGTAEKPIVFTSLKPKGLRNIGDWGGVWINGAAPSNTGANTAAEADLGVFFGGNHTTDNSGTLRYVRIEFGGIALQPNKEINGLTFAGVGSGTIVEHVQVSFCGDDAFEMFGGSVNLKNVVSYKNLDDDLDTDNGYNGNVQFGLVIRDQNIADQAGDSNGFESDNDATGSNMTPLTQPVFSNITVVGPIQDATTTISSYFKRGAYLRRNTQTSIFNSILMGFPIGIELNGQSTVTNYVNGDLRIKNNIISGWRTDSIKLGGGATMGTDFRTKFDQDGNTLYPLNREINLTAAYASTPNLLPAVGSPALTGASFSDAKLQSGFFQTVPYKGAFGSINWIAGWTNFDPQNTEY